MTLTPLVLAGLLLASLGACATTPNTGLDQHGAEVITSGGTGILVMAHGGDPQWNAAVEAALGPLRERAPVALAFGMADPTTLQAGIDTLAAEGVDRVAVVRMFLSGRSFEDQTRYLLGLSETPPSFFLHHPMPAHAGGHDAPDDASHAPDRHSATRDGPPPPVATHGLAIATHSDGLMDWAGVGAILRERAESTGGTKDAGVLLLGHGMGEDAEDQAVLGAMDAAAEALRATGWSPVAVETLREDWPEARLAAEARIEAWVRSRSEAGTPIIIPFRLSGFGPYAEVLDGLDYRSAAALLPHASIADWVEQTARRTACAEGWTPPTGAC